MKDVPEVIRADAVFEIKVNWSNDKELLANPFMQKAAEWRDRLSVKSIELGGDECTYVYYGCGSCGEGYAVVEAYCTSGGSQPDFRWCEAC